MEKRGQKRKEGPKEGEVPRDGPKIVFFMRVWSGHREAIEDTKNQFLSTREKKRKMKE